MNRKKKQFNNITAMTLRTKKKKKYFLYGDDARQYAWYFYTSKVVSMKHSIYMHNLILLKIPNIFTQLVIIALISLQIFSI